MITDNQTNTLYLADCLIKKQPIFFERFKLKSIEYVSELESKISAFRRRLTVEEIISDLTTAALEEKNAYGDNHWKCILELSLINSSLFMEKFK